MSEPMYAWQLEEGGVLSVSEIVHSLPIYNEGLPIWGMDGLNSTVSALYRSTDLG